MPLHITPFVGGSLDTNTWLVTDPETKTAIVIDAAEDTADLVQHALRTDGITAQAIVLTHTHWDHIADAAKMRRLLGVPLLGNSFATTRFPDGNIAAPNMPEIEPVAPDRNLDEGDDVTLGDHTFTVLFVPGHEPTHIALWSKADDVLLSGDVVFPGGNGTTEIPGSDQRVMNQTIRRLARLPETTVIYPGHGATTTIGAERPWMTALSSN